MNTARWISLLIASTSLVVAYGQDSSTAKPNLLTNPSFEDGKNGWEFHSANGHGQSAIDELAARGKKGAIRLDNPMGDDSTLTQAIPVKPMMHYRLSGYIKTRGIAGKGGASLGMEDGSQHSPFVTGTRAWTKVTMEFDSGAADTVKVGPRLGFSSGPTTGTAWFSELSLVEAGPSRKQ